MLKIPNLQSVNENMDLLNNYKIIIKYDGTEFSGWQRQQKQTTVQEKIETAIEIISKEKVNLIGSGRTDAGVHALGQTANFRISKDIDMRKFIYSLNSVLPSSISVNKIEKVHYDFHARYDAVSRSYLYIISQYKDPFMQRYSAFYGKQIEREGIERLNELSKFLIGEKDFSSFCRTKSEVNNKICKITNIHWSRRKNFIFMIIEANRFLHGMVRAITGTLVYMTDKNLGKDYLENILNSKNRTAAGAAFPGNGLFLNKIKY